MREVHLCVQTGGDEGMLGKLLAVVKRDRLALVLVGAQQCNHRFSHPGAVARVPLLRQCVARLALHQRDHHALVALADDGVTLPVAYAAAFVNDGRALLNADAVFERAAPLLPAGIAFATHLLAAQVAKQAPARALVGIDVLVDAFVADGDWPLQLEPSADLFGGEVQAQVAVYLAPLPCIELACIAP